MTPIVTIIRDEFSITEVVEKFEVSSQSRNRWMGLLQLWLTSLLRDVLPLEGWHHAEEVPCGVQA
jgi:hypothetical protein